AVGQVLPGLAELRRGGVADPLVGAKLLGLRELPIASRRDDGARADRLGHQQSEAPDAAADRLDQDVLPGLELDALDQAVPGGVTGQRQRRRLVELHPVGDALKVDRGDLAILSVPAVQLAAEPLLSLAELVAPERAGRAGATLDAILDDDPVAFLPSADAGSEPRHLTGDVEPQDARERAGGRASGADADDDVARPGVRIGAVAENELVRASCFGDVDGFHAADTSSRNLRSTTSRPAGLSPCTVWPACSTLTQRPSGRALARRSASSSWNTSLSAPRTTSVGHATLATADHRSWRRRS